MIRISTLAFLSIAAFALVGCGSSNSGGTPDTGTTAYGLSSGDNCYTVTAIAPGYIDGCAIGVETVVGTSLPMNYTAATATVTLGTNGSLGGGVVTYNQGTLNRDGDTTFTGTTCTLHQTDTSVLQMLANDKFTVSVTEVESNFGAACGSDAPPTDPCTSTWTWTMQKSIVATQVPPGCQ